MATIRLENITKVFSSAKTAATRAAKRQSFGYRYSDDRDFVKAARAQAAKEYAIHAAHNGAVLALDHINLIVPEGESLAIVGPSGCGKSTLLRVVAGLTEYEGTVYYDEENMLDIPPKERYIGMVFQDYALYPHFSGKGNLGFFFKMHAAPTPEAEARIRATSEIMGIGFEKLLARRPGTLSGGEQQRVAIGRAIVRQPQLLLFDEPLSNLDAKLRARTRAEIKRLIQRFTITTLYVTHDQTEAIALGDRIAVMRDGRIEQVGPYQTLRTDPDNAFVAGFMGLPPMNLFTGAMVVGRDVQLGEVRFPLPESIHRQTQEGQALTIGIHPETIQLAQRAQSTPPGLRLQGVLQVIEPDFAHQQQTLYLEVGGNTCAVITGQNVRLDVGDSVDIVFPSESLYFFDAQTEKRFRV